MFCCHSRIISRCSAGHIFIPWVWENWLRVSGKIFLPHNSNWHKCSKKNEQINKFLHVDNLRLAEQDIVLLNQTRNVQTHTHTAFWFIESVSTLLNEGLCTEQKAPPSSTLRVMEKIMAEFPTASKYMHFDPHLCTAWMCRSNNRQSWK